MLVLLRSDFRMESHRQAFYRLLRYAHVRSDKIFEVPVLEASTPAAIAARLRSLKPEPGMLIGLGTSRGESLEQTLVVLREIRRFIPYFEIFPTLIIARENEWKGYDQASSGAECFEFPQDHVLVLEQLQTYSDLTHRMTLAYLVLRAKGSLGKGPADAITTQQFMLGDRPSASHQFITDDMLAKAGIKVREDEPTAEVPIGDDDRITELPPSPDRKSGR